MTVATTPVQRFFKTLAKVEPYEIKASVLSFLYFFFLLGSYYILRPVRDAMGTVYGVDELEVLWTYTFFFSFLAAPIFGWFASRLKLTTLLPWTYGFFVINIMMFYFLFESIEEDKLIAGIFYCWVSVFNLFIISVFWSFMADVFSRQQAKRIFGFVAAGGSVGAAVGPAMTAILVNYVSTNSLLPISALGFLIAIVVVLMLEKEKEAMAATGQLQGQEYQNTRLDEKLGGNPFSGFSAVMKSPYLAMIAGFILMLTWVSTILYFEQAEYISKAFESREARTQAFAIVDALVNSSAILIQLFGTSRLVQRFGVTSALILVPAIMLFAFIGIAALPVLMMLLGVQVIRRVAEYAIARPGREMLFTIVDQESKYKAKNVIDTVIYRFGDLSSAWITSGLKALGVTTVGVAFFGVLVCIVWGAIAWFLGRKYEGVNTARDASEAAARPAAAE
jgi:ATP:ADP antiporter, AAA family